MGFDFDYGYAYGQVYGHMAAATVFFLIALGAVIALCIFCYTKFMGKNGDKTSKLGQLFDLKTLYLEKILKVLYMVFAIAIAVFAVVTPFVMWVGTGMFSMFLTGLINGALSLVVGEIICRLAFEALFMFVRLAGDTHAIRGKVVDGEEKEA